MKKNTLIILVLLISINTNAQNNELNHGITAVYINANSNIINKNYWLAEDSTPVKSRQYYLALSKKRRNAGWGFLVTGFGIMTAGLLISFNEYAPFDQVQMGIIMAGSGALLALGSIPFFISSSVNKQKAILAISIQPRSSIASSHSNKNITGISLNIPIH